MRSTLVSVQISKIIPLAAALTLVGAVAHADAPSRVVSINLCTDQLAMLIADDDQLISVSKLAADPRSSAMAEQAADLTPNSALAEEIYLLNPDLILAGTFSSRATVSMLERLGIPVILFDPAYSLDDVRDRMVQMGDALQQPDRAAELIAEYDASLAAYRAEITERPRAALYYQNGYTSGDSTLAGQILATAGFDNIAEDAGYPYGGFMPLELLALNNPDAIITGTPYPGASRSDEILDHPVVDHLRDRLPQAVFTDRDWVCGTPYVLRAIEDTAQLRRTMTGATE